MSLDDSSFINYTGFRCPRLDVHGYLYGCWLMIGAKTIVDGWVLDAVIQIMSPNSFCGHGKHKNGNRYWENLATQYEVQQTSTLSKETLTSVFHDGDLRHLYVAIDSLWLKLQGFPFGLQFCQKLTSFKSGELENSIITETTVQNLGDGPLDSFVFANVVDIAVGGAEHAMIAGTGDYCEVFNRDSEHGNAGGKQSGDQ